MKLTKDMGEWDLLLEGGMWESELLGHTQRKVAAV